MQSLSKYRAITLAAALAVPGAASALGNGTGNSDFTRIGVGARPAAMGQAYTAVADDSAAPFWNPSGLALISRGEVGLMHMAHIADINLDTLAFVMPTSRLSGWGLSAAYLWQPPFDSTKNSYGVTSQAPGTASDLALAASYARNLGNFRTTDFKISNISVGITARYVNRTLQDKQANAFNIDLGGTMEVLEGLKAALAVQNMGTTATFLNSADPAVMDSRLGFAYSLRLGDANRLLFAYDVGHPIDLGNPDYNRWHQNLGMEYGLVDMLFLRGGYQFGYDMIGLSAGAGFRFSSMGLDYAFVPYSVLGNVHRVSLSYSFGAAMSRPDVSAPNPPSGLKGLAFDQLVSLAWDASYEKDVIGYNVYYSKTSGRDYVRTTEKPEPKQNKLSVRLKNDELYYFVVTAVNASGKESEFSDEVLMKPHAPDKPKIPVELKADVAGRIVTLTWKPNPDKRVIGYNVYYSKEAGKAYRKLTKAAPLTDAECRLKGLSPDSAYFFVVTSVTKDGLESEYSSEVSARPRQDTLNEAAPAPAERARGKKPRREISQDAF